MDKEIAEKIRSRAQIEDEYLESLIQCGHELQTSDVIFYADNLARLIDGDDFCESMFVDVGLKLYDALRDECVERLRALETEHLKNKPCVPPAPSEALGGEGDSKESSEA